MSAGNGEDRDARIIGVPVSSTGWKFTLYAPESDNAALVLAQVVAQVDALLKQQAETTARIDAIERGASILSAWVRRPFWERVRGRLGL